MIKKLKKKKGFTLIELIVIIAILAVLVILASPRFLGRTKEAVFTKHISNTKVIQNASELYFMDKDDWPRLTDEPYTSEEIEEYAESVYTITGETIELDPNGNYYNIDYNALNDYVSVNNEDKPYYILQNPVGKVYYMDGLSELGKNRADFNSSNGDNDSDEEQTNGYTKEQIDELVSQGYIIVSNSEDLNNVRNDLFGKYIQVNDIDLSDYSEGEGWSPIGEDGEEFEGTFNGGNFKITGLTIDRSTSYNGLFGKANGATIENVGLEDVNVNGGNRTGGLVGFAGRGSLVHNSYSTGTVRGGNQTGGLVGWSAVLTIRQSYSNANVNGSTETGGLAGFTQVSTIENSYATGTVNGGNRTGGLVGRSRQNSHIENTYAIGLVNGRDNTGGLVGELVRLPNRSTVENSYWDINTTGTTISSGEGSTGKTTSEMQQQETFEGWDFDTIWEITPGNYPTLR